MQLVESRDLDKLGQIEPDVDDRQEKPNSTRRLALRYAAGAAVTAFIITAIVLIYIGSR